MRKLVLMGFSALFLSILSFSVFAGDKSICDEGVLFEETENEVVYDKKLLQQLGVYGLCVAYQNASEEDKPGLAAKFEDRADFPVPGSEVATDLQAVFTCPCWSDISYVDVCELGSPFNSDFGDTTVWFFADFDEFTSGEERIYSFNSVNSTPKFCAFSIEKLKYDEINDQWVTDYFERMTGVGDLSDSESETCNAEVKVIATMFEEGLCDF
jgi:hypothetical protein